MRLHRQLIKMMSEKEASGAGRLPFFVSNHRIMQRTLWLRGPLDSDRYAAENGGWKRSSADRAKDQYGDTHLLTDAGDLQDEMNTVLADFINILWSNVRTGSRRPRQAAKQAMQ